MFEIPPEVRATWPAPNFVNPVTRGPALIIVVVISIALAIGIAILRTYTRLRVTRSFGSDDTLILIAMIPTIGLAVVVLLANIVFGWNRHIWDLKPDEFMPGEKMSFAAIVLFAAASGLTKLSLLAFYRRLLPAKGKKGARTYKWLIWGFIIFNIITTVAFIVDLILICRPIKAFWSFTPPTFRPTFPFTCRDHGAVIFRASLINTVIDFNILLIPIPLVWRLNIPRRQRILVIVLFMLGLTVVAAGAVKTFFIKRAMIDSFDEQWDAFPLWILTTVEIDLGIICASAPALRPFISAYYPKLLDQAIHRVSKGSFRRPIMKKMISRPIEGTFVRDGQRPPRGRDSKYDESIRTASSDFSMDSVLLSKQIAALQPLPEIPRSSHQEWETLSKLFKATPDPPPEGKGLSPPAESIQSRARQVASRLSTAFRFSLPRSSIMSGAPSGMYTLRKSNAETIQVMMANEPPLPTRRPTLHSKFSTNWRLYPSKDGPNVNGVLPSSGQRQNQPQVQIQVTAPRTSRTAVVDSVGVLRAMPAVAMSQGQPQLQPSISPINSPPRPAASATSPELVKAAAREKRPISPPETSARTPDFPNLKTPQTNGLVPLRPSRPESSKSPLYNGLAPPQAPPLTPTTRASTPPLASPIPEIARSVTQPTGMAVSSRPQLISLPRSQPSLALSDEVDRSARPSLSQSNAINFSRPTFATLGNSTMASRQGSAMQIPIMQPEPRSEIRAPPPPGFLQSRVVSRDAFPQPSKTPDTVRSRTSDFRADSVPMDLIPAPLDFQKRSSISPTEAGPSSLYPSMYNEDNRLSMSSKYSSIASSLVADAGWDRPAAIAKMQSEMRQLRDLQAEMDAEAQISPEAEGEMVREGERGMTMGSSNINNNNSQMLPSTVFMTAPQQQRGQAQVQRVNVSPGPGPGPGPSARMPDEETLTEEGKAF